MFEKRKNLKKNPMVCMSFTLNILKIFLVLPPEDEMLKPRALFFFRFVVVSILGSLPLLSSITHLMHTIIVGEDNLIETDLTYIVSFLTSYVAVWAFIIKLKHSADMYIFLSDFESFGRPKNFDVTNNNFNKYAKIHLVYLEAVVCTAVFTSNILTKGSCRQDNISFNMTEVCGLVTNTWMPFDVDYSPVWEIYLIIEIIGGHYIYMLIGLMAWLVFETVQHVIVRIRDLKYVMTVALSQKNPVIRRKQFNFAIRYHNALLSLVDKLNEAFSIFMFTHMVVTSIILGIAAYTFLHANSVSTIMICVGWFFGLFADCISGQRLKDETSELAVAIYDSPWYDCEQELKKDILMVLRKCQTCQVLRAGAFGIMERAMFVSVLKVTYSYITLLRR